jgi:hypothetical protein
MHRQEVSSPSSFSPCPRCDPPVVAHLASQAAPNPRLCPRVAMTIALDRLDATFGLESAYGSLENTSGQNSARPPNTHEKTTRPFLKEAVMLHLLTLSPDEI